MSLLTAAWDRFGKLNCLIDARRKRKLEKVKNPLLGFKTAKSKSVVSVWDQAKERLPKQETAWLEEPHSVKIETEKRRSSNFLA